MLILEHLKQMVDACYPENDAERRLLWADIKPIKFGNTVSWLAAGEYGLANYQVPDEASYLIVLRVECYTVNFTSGSADYGIYEPPPPGAALWRYVPYGAGATYNVTRPSAPIQRLCDADEMLFFKGGYNVFLIGDLLDSPDGDTRSVRTLVYGYNIGASIASRIGRGYVEIPNP